MLIVLVIFICGVIWGATCRLRSCNKCAVEKPMPQNPARQALLDLFKIKKNISKNSYAEVSAMLSNVLKQYLARVFSYIHIGMTNTEITEALRQDARNDWQTISQITEILSLTERVNFAKKQLGVPQQMGLYRKTGHIILKIWQSKRRKYANR